MNIVLQRQNKELHLQIFSKLKSKNKGGIRPHMKVLSLHEKQSEFKNR